MSHVRVDSPGLDYIHDDLDNIRRASSSSDGSRSFVENRSPPPRPASTRPTSTRRPLTQEREQVLSNSTNRLLARLLAREDRDAQKIDTIVSFTSEQLEKETLRANEAERKALVALTQLKTQAEAKRLVEQEAARLREELRLYKLQLENAQKEINRAQQIVDEVEAERKEAEADAVRFRGIARKFKEERLVDNAREEGRRTGYQEGLRRGLIEARLDRYGRRQEDYDMLSDEDERAQDRSPRGSPSSGSSSPPIPPRSRTPAGPPPPQPPRAPTRTSNRTPSNNGYRSTHVPDVALHAPTLPVRTVTTPLNLPSPSHARATDGSSSNLPQSPEVIRPIPVYNIPVSPSYRTVDVPQDGWIPHAERDSSFIPVPPPHEFGNTPRSQSVQPLPIPDYEHEQGFPFPHVPTRPQSAIRARDYGYNGESSTHYAPPNRVPTPSRPWSRTSTRVSDYEILSPPGSRSRAETQARSHTPAGSGKGRASRSERPRADSVHRRSASPQGPRPSRPNTPRRDDTSERPLPDPPVDRTGTRSPGPLGWLLRRNRRKNSTPPDIRVEPPSGSPSTASNGSKPGEPNFNYLSPDHASQPLPMAVDDPIQQVPAPAIVNQMRAPPMLSDGQLPPGFVPVGPPVPVPVPPPEQPLRTWTPSPGLNPYLGAHADVKAPSRQRAGSDTSMSSAPLNRPLSIFNE